LSGLLHHVSSLVLSRGLGTVHLSAHRQVIVAEATIVAGGHVPSRVGLSHSVFVHWR